MSIGALLLATVVINGHRSGSGASASSPQAVPSPPINVTADDLYRAYDANEAAAQERYGSGMLKVSGTVASIGLDLANNPVVRLSTPNEFSPVHAALSDESKPKAAALAKGQRLTVTCRHVHEIAGTPMLDDCAI